MPSCPVSMSCVAYAGASALTPMDGAVLKKGYFEFKITSDALKKFDFAGKDGAMDQLLDISIKLGVRKKSGVSSVLLLVCYPNSPFLLLEIDGVVNNGTYPVRQRLRGGGLGLCAIAMNVFLFISDVQIGTRTGVIILFLMRSRTARDALS